MPAPPARQRQSCHRLTRTLSILSSSSRLPHEYAASRPRALRPGAPVALVAPAGPLPDGAIERAQQRVRELGWEPVLGRHARRRRGYLAGTDEERLADFSFALESEDIEGIWCLRGGYGTMRLLRGLDLAPLRERPRPLIGFSDNTTLHLLARRAGVVTFHGPHPGAENVSSFSLDLLKRILEDGDRPLGRLPLPTGSQPPLAIVPGSATGALIGGNLSLLAATIGTDVEVSAEGAILFLEEVGEPAYRLDRLLTQLVLSGVLDGVAGIAVGAITECSDAGTNGNPTATELVSDRLRELGVPVACGFPFGHVPDNWTLPVGAMARLEASAGTLELLEPAVAP